MAVPLLTPYTAVISGYRRREDKSESTDAHEAMLSMFLQRKHPMPTVLTECKTYLYQATHMTRQLLEHGLDPNLPDWQRRTPLHDVSAGNRHVKTATELVRMFLEHGADIDATNEEDRSTPLGVAAREGDADLVALLLERGADPKAAGAAWAMPLAWAQRRGHAEIAELLRGRGAADSGDCRAIRIQPPARLCSPLYGAGIGGFVGEARGVQIQRDLRTRGQQDTQKLAIDAGGANLGTDRRGGIVDRGSRELARQRRIPGGPEVVLAEGASLHDQLPSLHGIQVDQVHDRTLRLHLFHQGGHVLWQTWALPLRVEVR